MAIPDMQKDLKKVNRKQMSWMEYVQTHYLKYTYIITAMKISDYHPNDSDDSTQATDSTTTTESSNSSKEIDDLHMALLVKLKESDKYPEINMFQYYDYEDCISFNSNNLYDDIFNTVEKNMKQIKFNYINQYGVYIQLIDSHLYWRPGGVNQPESTVKEKFFKFKNIIATGSDTEPQNPAEDDGDSSE